MAVVSASAARRSGDRRPPPLLVLAPVPALFLVFSTIPLPWLPGPSFHDFSLASGMPPEYVGLRDHEQLWLGRNKFGGDLGRTFTFVALAVGIPTTLGVALGLLFRGSRDMSGRRRRRGRSSASSTTRPSAC